MDYYIINVFIVELMQFDAMANATMQQVMPLKHAVLQQSDDLHAGIKVKLFLFCHCVQ